MSLPTWVTVDTGPFGPRARLWDEHWNRVYDDADRRRIIAAVTGQDRPGGAGTDEDAVDHALRHLHTLTGRFDPFGPPTGQGDDGGEDEARQTPPGGVSLAFLQNLREGLASLHADSEAPAPNTPGMQHANRAQSILQDADATIADRHDDYGHPERSLDTIASLWSTYLQAAAPASAQYVMQSIQLEGRDVAMMMTLMKTARDAHQPKRDNLIDIAGYAALADEAEGGTA